jgi:hypothetical protein
LLDRRDANRAAPAWGRMNPGAVSPLTSLRLRLGRKVGAAVAPAPTGCA